MSLAKLSEADRFSAGRRQGVRHDPGMADDLEQQYRALVERVPSYPMPEAARAAILAEIEATYRRERAAIQRSSTSSL